MKKALLLFAFIITLQAAAQKENARFKKIDSLLTYLYQNGRFMGSVALREKDKVVFEKAYGFADLTAKTPATVDTKYKAGNITKMFTATIIFQLIDEKKLTLETKLSDFFPKVENAKKITIAQMLTHSSGIFSYTDDPDFAGFYTRPQTRRDLLGRIYNYSAAFEPGEKSAYSATDYLLLGYIIQDITKKSYKDNLASRIISKAGLKDTYYFSKINPKKKEAYSYLYANSDYEKQEEWNESVAGATAGVQSTPDDLTKFMGALFSGKLLLPESLAKMNETNSFGYGYGIVHFDFGERKFTGQNGDIEGFQSVAAYYAKDQLGFSLVSNALNFDFNQIALGVLSCYYKLPYRFPLLTTVEVDEVILKSYEGNYASPTLPFTINVKLVEGKLRVHAEEQGTFYITPINDTEFIHDASGVKMTFTPTAFTLQQNGTETVFTKQ